MQAPWHGSAVVPGRGGARGVCGGEVSLESLSENTNAQLRTALTARSDCPAVLCAGILAHSSPNALCSRALCPSVEWGWGQESVTRPPAPAVTPADSRHRVSAWLPPSLAGCVAPEQLRRGHGTVRVGPRATQELERGGCVSRALSSQVTLPGLLARELGLRPRRKLAGYTC